MISAETEFGGGRRIGLCEFFHDPEASEDEGNHQEDRRFREKSRWTPPKNRVAAIESYLKAVEKDVWCLTRSIKRKDNLHPSKRNALIQLRAHSDIIKPATKGSAGVVMSKDAYLAEAHRQLLHTSYYRRPESDPTPQHLGQLTELVH